MGISGDNLEIIKDVTPFKFNAGASGTVANDDPAKQSNIEGNGKSNVVELQAMDRVDMSQLGTKSKVRVALTQTVNAYPHMPSKKSELHQLMGKMHEIRQANVTHNIGLITEAKSAGADVVCLGEVFTGPYFGMTKDAMWFDMAEDAQSGPTVLAIKETSAKHGMVIIAPIYEYDAEQDQRFNTAVVFDNGKILGKFRKMHIPIGSNEQGEFVEPFYYDRGDGNQNQNNPHVVSTNPYFPVFKTSAGKIGIGICYDRHFEGVAREFSEGGAEMVFCPSITFGKKSNKAWHTEFLVDAARHNLYIAGSNRKGHEAPWNQPFFGESYVTGPDYNVLDNLSTNPELVIADLDLERVRSGMDPSGWKLQAHARDDVFENRSKYRHPQEVPAQKDRAAG
ncbi:MAG: hypothetical protein A2289_13525 [Deltaproteobacteria bacterium RIFOXYA12_FULL_58_15]|nr:MAG: hypothetical protein A2289_13525 [Deltaproteobacteria bacterium RIFOXYA12_FULL_58_15]OGR09543.1 MAG: hypothetical protein A2341_16670 [Deltaproteobacteria bacterium RIFOXYB12_FULL_58_9]